MGIVPEADDRIEPRFHVVGRRDRASDRGVLVMNRQSETSRSERFGKAAAVGRDDGYSVHHRLARRESSVFGDERRKEKHAGDAMEFARIERVRHFVEIRVRRDVEVKVREIGDSTSAFDEKQRNIGTLEHKFVSDLKPYDEPLGGIGIDEREKPWRAIGLGDDDTISIDHEIDVGRVEPEGIDVKAATIIGGGEDVRRECEGRSTLIREVMEVEDDGNVPFSGVFHQRFHHAMTSVDEEDVGFPMIEDGC